MQSISRQQSESMAYTRMFYLMSPTKLLIMNVITFGLYQWYWWYRQWRAVRVSENSKIIPILRTIFAVFFVYGLTRRVFFGRGALLWALGFYTILLTQLILKLILLKFGLVIAVCCWFLQILWYILLQEQINQRILKEQPKTVVNSGFTGLNIVGILCFIFLVGLLVLGANGPSLPH